jgi:hypothetical protein
MTALGAPKATGHRRKQATIRQQRWRHRQRVKTRVRAELESFLGREPTDAEMLAGVESELERLGMGVAGDPCAAWAADGDEPVLTSEAATTALDALAPDEPDDDDGGDEGAVPKPLTVTAAAPVAAEVTTPPAAAAGGQVVDFKQAAAALLPEDHPARNSLGRLERALALGSVAFELRIAASRERIFQLLVRHAEQGDVSAAIWLASRLAPPAKQRRTVAIPEFNQLDLRTLDGVQAAIDLVIRNAAAGDLDLADLGTMLDALQKRQQALEASAKAQAYHAAAEQLRERTAGGLAARLASVRARIADRAAPPDDAPLLELEPEALD